MTDLAKYDFQEAVWRAGYQNDKQRLIELLESGGPKTAADQRYLARWLRGDLKPPRGRKPRRATDVLTDLVMFAAHFARTIKKAHRGRGSERISVTQALDEALKRMRTSGLAAPDSNSVMNLYLRSKRAHKKQQ